MLSLKKIVKSYRTGDTEVQALKGIDLEFRKSEFVSILGPSGCGKTTLLNIIGGLDRYDSGELSIKGKSTKSFSDSDWDSYRNHSIGFVFQSYNLIPHQSVLSNVELALTLSGVPKAERRKRAADALAKVGLADQLHKKPGQMSGGQMQRVAIARALVNDPEILLADEPTGALDSVTSVQIMEILKEISKDRLIIMVTHNPELAEKYSTRIVRLSDGRVTSDSDPYTAADETANVAKTTEVKKKRAKGKTSMSFLTALSLSTNNLMTKKGRTFLTSFAGSIGIIGIALILALSNGIQLYINKVQEDTLSSYPISIAAQTVDYTSMVESLMGKKDDSSEHELDAVYSNSVMFEMMNVMISEVQKNNLSDFKKYLDSKEKELRENNKISDISYGYDFDLNIYSPDTSNGITKLGMDIFYETIYGQNSFSQMQQYGGASFTLFSEMINNPELISSQYDLLAGKMPEKYDEIVLVLDKHNEISDMALYALGLKDRSELKKIMDAAMKGEQFEIESAVFSYEDMLNTKFRLVLPSDLYSRSASGGYRYVGDNEDAMKSIISGGITLNIVGIIRPNEDAVASSITGSVAYTHELTEYIINQTNNSEIVKAQLADPKTDVLTGLPFPDDSYVKPGNAEKAAAVKAYFDSLSPAEMTPIIYKVITAANIQKTAFAQLSAMSGDEIKALLVSSIAAKLGVDEKTAEGYLASMSEEDMQTSALAVIAAGVAESVTKATADELGKMSADELSSMFEGYIATLGEDELAALYDQYMPATVSSSSYEENVKKLGICDLDNPSTINIYPVDFKSKDEIKKLISDYNDSVAEKDKITYTDYVAILMSSVSTIINFVSYALIAFVSISLVVSSIMIGIITYISVLERTKEIGILRAIGASKRDISRVFNAETFIVGLAAGVIGIGISLLLCLPINLIISALSGVNNIASLPLVGSLILIAISIALTLIAGLIPAKIAARKDPVIALRSE